SLNPHFFAPSLARSAVFLGKVDGVALDILTHAAADHTSFECAGDVVVELTVSKLNNASVVVRPLRLGIKATVAGDRVRLKIPGPQNLQIEINGKPLLYVYALPPAPPTPCGPLVRVFASGEVHEVGLLL